MKDIESIVTAWLVSPFGLVVTAIVIILSVVLTLASLMSGMPSEE